MVISDRLSLRQRLLLWLLPPIVLLTGIWIWASYAIVLRFANLTYDWALEDTAQTLASQVRVEPGKVEVNLPPAARRMLEFDQVDDIYFSVSDTRERQLVGNRVLPGNPAGDSAPAQTRFYDDRVDGQRLRLVEYKVSGGAGEVLFVRVAETLHKRKILAREVMAYMLAPQLLFLAGIVLLVWFGSGRGIASLRQVRDALSRRSDEDLSPLDETGLPAEVHEQVRVINGLMTRLGRTIAGPAALHRRCHASVAHADHRAPDPDRTGPACSRSGAVARHRRPARRAATARLARLANQLLNLSRAEAGLLDTSNLECFGVAELVEDVVAGLAPAALDKQIDIRVDIAAALPVVRGDRQLLSEMLVNLVDNAIRYTPAGGRIDVDVGRIGERVVFGVTDNGPGIPEAERQRVLKRFYRGIDAGAEGSGLGLAIAREIISLHGGRIDLATAPGGAGLRVTVEIPSATLLAPPSK